MSETRSDMPVAVVLQRIVVHAGVSGDDLERYLLQEVFPSLDTSGEGERRSASGSSADRGRAARRRTP